MSVKTIEAFVENGQIRLPPNTRLPEHAKVYVVVPETTSKIVADPSKVFEVSLPKKVVHLRSPRLVNRADLSYFKMKFTPAPVSRETT